MKGMGRRWGYEEKDGDGRWERHANEDIGFLLRLMRSEWARKASRLRMNRRRSWGLLYKIILFAWCGCRLDFRSLLVKGGNKSYMPGRGIVSIEGACLVL